MFTGFSVSFTSIIIALALSMDACVIACIMFCSAATPFCVSLCLRLAYVSLPDFLHSSLPYVRLLSLYFLVSLMWDLFPLLLTLCYVTCTEAGSPVVASNCHLLHTLSLIIKFSAIHTSVHLYTIIICELGMVVYMCLCMLLLIACVLYFGLYVCQLWHVHICGNCIIMHICYVTVHVYYYYYIPLKILQDVAPA